MKENASESMQENVQKKGSSTLAELPKSQEENAQTDTVTKDETKQPAVSKPRYSPFEKWKIRFDIFGLLVALSGFIIAFHRCNEVVTINKRQTAINEIYKLKNKDYLNTLARLHIVAATSSSSDTAFKCEIILQLYEAKSCLKANDLLMGDISYSFNTFENISAFYANDLVDRAIMEKLICDEVKEFGYILSRVAPVLRHNSGEYFDRLPWADFDSLMMVCGRDTTKLKVKK